MRHLAAAMLLALAGKEVNEKSIKDVLTAAGVKPDDAKVTQIVNEVKGKDVLKLAKEGLSKAPAATSAPVESKNEEKKDDKKGKKEEKPVEKPVEEEEDGGIGDLFGF